MRAFRINRPRRRGVGAAMLLILVLAASSLAAVAAAPEPATVANNPSAPCTYRAAFVADVTVPDNTALPANTAFSKVWRLRNTGTCAWGPGKPVDALAFAGGSQLGAAALVPLTAVIYAGQVGDVTVTLTTPAAAGTYRSEWKLHRADGITFGLGSAGLTPIYVKFRVLGGGPTAPPAPQRIQFAAGATVGSVQGAVTFPTQKSYLLRASAGQAMVVAIVSANEVANFAITGVTDGIPYKRLVNEDRYFTMVLPATQDYRIDVATPGSTASYVLSVAIAP